MPDINRDADDSNPAINEQTACERAKELHADVDATHQGHNVRVTLGDKYSPKVEIETKKNDGPGIFAIGLGLGALIGVVVTVVIIHARNKPAQQAPAKEIKPSEDE